MQRSPSSDTYPMLERCHDEQFTGFGQIWCGILHVHKDKEWPCGIPTEWERKTSLRAKIKDGERGKVRLRRKHCSEARENELSGEQKEKEWTDHSQSLPRIGHVWNVGKHISKNGSGKEAIAFKCHKRFLDFMAFLDAIKDVRGSVLCVLVAFCLCGPKTKPGG